MNKTRTPPLKLALQFPAAKAFPEHKAMLSRATVVRWIQASLFADAELTVRLVDADEGRLLNRTYSQSMFSCAARISDAVSITCQSLYAESVLMLRTTES